MAKQNLYNFVGSYNKAYKSATVEVSEFNMFLDSLKPKYLFANQEIQKFEDDFYDLIYKLYYFYTKEDKSIWIDRMKPEIEKIANRICDLSNLFAKDLSINISLLKKIKIKFVKFLMS